ncbi:MAG: hypothetical protein V5A47_08110, partial [Bacteroidales bacterium]
MHFEGARYFDSQSLLPSYYELIPLNNAQEHSIKLVDKKFEPVSSASVLNEKAKKSLHTNIQVESRLQFDRSKPHLQLHFVPLRKNPVTGNVEKLVNFGISLERKSTVLKSTGRYSEKET